MTPFRESFVGWTGLSNDTSRYEEHRYPPFQLQAHILLCRQLLGLPPAEVSPNLRNFILERRRPNGSFNQVKVEDGGDGHVMHTWWGLQSLAALGLPLDLRAETIRWLQACQLPIGGFTYAPGADVGAVDDVDYTWAALRALHLLGAAPVDREGALRYLASLRNADGGFGHRPGWHSNPTACYSALDAVDTLGERQRILEKPVPRTQPATTRPKIAQDLKVFTLQVQAPGSGSPSDAVDLAAALTIHLWGAKNAKPGWIAAAQAIAKQRGVPVTFFPANEEYGTHAAIGGLGDYNHISDIMAAPGKDPGPSLAGTGPLTWKEFRKRRLAALEQADGLLYWQFGDNEEYARAVLDESVERGGYAAISTFHFGNPDFPNSEPWLYRYYGRLPFITLQDAHGTEAWWWTDVLAGFRTLFLGTEPTWEAWRTALKNNWVAAVRHDALSHYQTWRHGMPEVLEFMTRREDQWRWWGDRPEAIRRPHAVVAVIRPEDPYEAGRPEQGIALRVRCWSDATTQGVLKQERVRLVRLELDGRPIETQPAHSRDPRGRLIDRYHRAALPAAPPGHHVVSALVERLDDRTLVVVQREFEV